MRIIRKWYLKFSAAQYLHSSAEDTAVQIFCGTLDLNVKIANASQAVCDAWFLLAQPIIIGNANVVNVMQEIFFACEQQFVKSFAARLFHALEYEFNVHRQRDVKRLETFDGMNPTENGSFVIGWATSEQFAIDFGQNKGVGVPTVFAQCRLHVQMTVNAYGFFGGVLRKYILRIIIFDFEKKIYSSFEENVD